MGGRGFQAARTAAGQDGAGAGRERGGAHDRTPRAHKARQGRPAAAGPPWVSRVSSGTPTGPRGLHWLARLPVAAVIAGCAGYLADLLGLPLAWLLGAAVATAAICLTVGPVRVPGGLYRTGQVFVGAAVGLTVTSDILARLGPHALLAPAGALVSIAIGRAIFPVLARYGGVSRQTAYFALVPAGIAEMAEQAGKRGADMAAVGTFHASRVGLMVLILPIVVLQIGEPVGREAAAPATWAAAGWTPSLLVAFAVAGIAAPLASRIGVPSGWLLGPMAALAVLSGAGAIDAKEPELILALAQVLLGLGIGARFTRETVARLPRALAVGVPLMIGHAAVMAALGLAVAVALALEPEVMLLGYSTGGIAEMVLTAKAVGADAALVTAYQVTRGILGNLLGGALYDRTVAGSSPAAGKRG